MQTDIGQPAESPMPRPMTSRPSAEQRAAFFVALEQTGSARKASLAAGVSRETGRNWAKQAKVAKAEQQARAGVIATKTEIAQKLTEIALHDADVAPRDRVNAVAALSKVMGYDAPTRTESIVINASVQQWIEAQRQTALVQGAPAKELAGGEPPIQQPSSSLSHPPNISQNSESGDGK